MRHFAHHIGDYAAATAHLSMVEDAAYHRLLRLCYQNEEPLPNDEKEIFRRVRARNPREKAGTLRVLHEFFTLESDGCWHQARADEEISKYKHLVEAGREGGIKSGVARSLKQNRTNHKPLTTNQEPLTKEDKIPRQARKAKLPDDWQPSEELLAYAAEQGCSDPLDTAERFRLHHQSKGTLGVNWSKGFQFWCRNQKNFARPQQTNFRPNGPAETHVDGDGQWGARMRGWHQSKFWKPYDWGPEPDNPRTLVPPHLLKDAA